MKKKIKKTTRKTTKRAFAFQDFIEINKIDIKELPDYIQTMIRIISKQRKNSKLNCTSTHYRIVKGKLQEFANIVEDYFMNEYDSKLQNNVIKEEVSEEPSTNKTVKSIIELSVYYDRNYLLTSELRSLGVEVDYSKKEIKIDELRLERELTTAKWYIGVDENYKGGAS